MKSNEARAARDAAVEKVTRAQRDEGAAVLALSDASDAYGDNPCPETERAWREARDKRELAALAVTGAARKADAARAALHEAEQNEARAALAAALPIADRRGLFARLADAIATMATADAAPPVDVYQGDDGAVLAALDSEHERRIERARAARVVRREVTAQHAAVLAAVAASKVLGTVARVAPVDEAHIDAAVALEAYALNQPRTVEALWWGAWLQRFRPPGMPGTMSWDAATACGGDVGRWIEVGRECYRTGDDHGPWREALHHAEVERAAARAEQEQIRREQGGEAPPVDFKPTGHVAPVLRQMFPMGREPRAIS